jgi:hypothetical protein
MGSPRKTFASFFCSVFLFFFVFYMLRVVSNVCFFMQRSYDVAGWMPIRFQKVLFFSFFLWLGISEALKRRWAGIPPRVTRGSHFGANKKKTKKSSRSACDGKENQGVGK